MALTVFGALALASFPAAARDQTADTSVARPAQAGIPHPPPPPRPAALGRSYATVFRAIELRDWAKARALAARTDEPMLSDVISWVRFTTRGEYMDFDEVTAFIETHPDWPQMRDLRENAEEALNKRVPDARVLAWFEKHPPITPKGAMYLIDALMRKGETARAEELVRRAWVEKNFAAPMERTFYSRYRRMLRTTDHEQRMDRLLWVGRSWEARRLLRRIKSGYNAVAVARMRLRAFAGGVDWALRRVPEDLMKDPGLAYERLRWRRRKGRDDEAIELLKDLPAVLPRPALLWHEQGILARRALRDGKAELAYRLASDHRQTEGESFADAEFLAGFIALRHLKKPDVALTHFTRLFDRVNYPVSRARGAYWAGRATRELGDMAVASLWFELGAAHITTFYGQLAAIELDNGSPVARPIPETPAIAEAEAQAFARRSVVQAAQLMAGSPERDHFKSFVRHLVRLARTPAEHALVSSVAIAAGRADVAVWAAKDSLKDGVHLIDTGWPREPLPENRRGLENGIVLALMRQESAFNPDAVSWAGARGLMQLMPATARKVARGLGLPFSRERLLSDPAYNMAIGSTYFSQVLEEFSGSYVLALAAYNAGPARAHRWLKDLGDFRRGEIDAVDWIEMIPFDETRDYVQRVIENVQVYRALFDGRQMRIIPPGSIGG